MHYHLVVACSEDIRKGFDFEAFGACQTEFGRNGRSDRFWGDHFKGARMVRYSRGWRYVSQNVAWYEGGKRWRLLLQDVALLLGVSTMDQMLEKVGSQWAYKDITLGEIALAIVPP